MRTESVAPRVKEGSKPPILRQALFFVGGLLGLVGVAAGASYALDQASGGLVNSAPTACDVVNPGEGLSGSTWRIEERFEKEGVKMDPRDLGNLETDLWAIQKDFYTQKRLIPQRGWKLCASVAGGKIMFDRIGPEKNVARPSHKKRP